MNPSFVFSKVTSIKFYYINIHGHSIAELPSEDKFYSLGILFNKDEAASIKVGDEWEMSTMYSLASKVGRVDVWKPKLEIQLDEDETLIYTGKKAADAWREWCLHRDGNSNTLSSD